jgi:hypothetical protein
MRDPWRERLYDLPVIEPAGYRVGWAPEERRIVVQFGAPDEFVTFGLSVEMADALAESLRAKAHEHRPKAGRDA